VIRSMTGYARAHASGEWGELVWELRSVNHRYLDLNLRLPESVRALEPEVRRRAGKALGRGKVECALRYSAEVEGGPLEIDAQRLDELVEACQRVAVAFAETAPVDPLRALQWPGVVKEVAPDADALTKAALAAFQEALSELDAARAAEGERLDAFFRERLQTIGELVASVRRRLPRVQDEWRKKLESRMAELEQPLDPGRLEQEFVIAAQKSDVEEELSRLDMHIEAFQKALSKDGPVGRRLDFLMQEFNREANTLSSKSQDAEIRQLAVDMKVAIEQMREQVQNIE